jgi:type VII secretion protein EccB
MAGSPGLWGMGRRVVASRQDQLHSYQFSVQRVVSALVMRESEPERSPFRRVAGATLAGALLAALSLAGVAVYGVLTPGGGSDWRDTGAVIVEQESGARYVYGTDGLLHPVPNYASALLVIGSAQARTVSVSRAALDGVPRGAALGIPGAPDPLPDRDRLLGGPWTLCSAHLADGVRSILYIGQTPAGGTALPDGQALLVAAPDRSAYLVWRHLRYPVSPAALVALAWGAETPTPVAGALINALATGPELAAPQLPGRSGPSKVAGARVGQVFVETVPGGGRQYAVAVPDGLAAVSQLQAALLLADPAVPDQRGARELSPGEFTADLVARPLTPTGDLAPPATIPPLAHPQAPASARGLCATVGGTVAFDVPLPVVGTRLPVPPAGSERFADRVVIAAGHGALVSAAPAPGAAGTVSVVSELGIRYPLSGGDVPAMLGYGGVSPVPVPSSLVTLLPAGPSLDPLAARTPSSG